MLNRVKEKKLDEFVKWNIKIKKILMEIWNEKFWFVIIEILLIIFVLYIWLIKDLLILTRSINSNNFYALIIKFLLHNKTVYSNCI